MKIARTTQRADGALHEESGLDQGPIYRIPVLQ
jgi:hypothetical protein